LKLNYQNYGSKSSLKSKLKHRLIGRPAVFLYKKYKWQWLKKIWPLLRPIKIIDEVGIRKVESILLEQQIIEIKSMKLPEDISKLIDFSYKNDKQN